MPARARSAVSTVRADVTDLPTRRCACIGRKPPPGDRDLLPVPSLPKSRAASGPCCGRFCALRHSIGENTMNRPLIALACTASMLLAACGGGGSSSAAAPAADAGTPAANAGGNNTGGSNTGGTTVQGVEVPAAIAVVTATN
jgi:hypothetical protein